MAKLLVNEGITSESSLVVVPFSVILADQSELKLALNVHKVLRVVEPDQIDPVPAEFDPFIGVYNHDGESVPVLDLARAFNETTVEPNKTGALHNKRVIICNVLGMNVGVLVNKTRKLEQHSGSSVSAPPPALSQESYFSAVIRGSTDAMYLLDIEAILEKHGVSLDKKGHYIGKTPELHGKRILVVEDSRIFQKRVVQILTHLGAEADVAYDGLQGLEMYKANPDRYDLIFTDVEMPNMNGIEMVLEIHKLPGKKPLVLFNSAISNQNLIDEITEQKLGEYLVKFDEKSIMEKLGSVLAS